MREEPIKTQYPETERRVAGQDAQSESANPDNFKGELTEKKSPFAGQLFKYFKTINKLT